MGVESQFAPHFIRMEYVQLLLHKLQLALDTSNTLYVGIGLIPLLALISLTMHWTEV